MKFHFFGYRFRFISPSGFSFSDSANADSAEHEIKRLIRVKKIIFPRLVRKK